MVQLGFRLYIIKQYFKGRIYFYWFNEDNDSYQNFEKIKHTFSGVIKEKNKKNTLLIRIVTLFSWFCIHWIRLIVLLDTIWRKTIFDERRPLTEDDLWQKATFDGRRPLTEDDLWQKTTFDGRWRQPLTIENLRQKTTFDRRLLLTEDNGQSPSPIENRHLRLHYDLWQKTTYDRK